MKLFVKILAFICQIIVLVLIFVDKTEGFEWQETQILTMALNGLSIALLMIPSKFNDIYEAGYKKIRYSSSDSEDDYVETLGWKGVFFAWIGATIGSFLAAVFFLAAYRWFLWAIAAYFFYYVLFI